MAIDTSSLDVPASPQGQEAQLEILADAFERGDPIHLARTLGIVARARGMTRIAREAGVTREALYKALSENGDPKLSTLLGVMKALGVQLTAKPVAKAQI